jgi:hypothetical protein
MKLLSAIINTWNNWFLSPEECYLSRSVDLADFERRQRLWERDKSKSFMNQIL